MVYSNWLELDSGEGVPVLLRASARVDKIQKRGSSKVLMCG